MTNQAKATPKPWRLYARNGQLDLNGFSGRDTTENYSDASLIVKAVNNHEQLLEACKKALHVHIDYVRESGDDSIEANEYQEMLSQAIEQATK